METLLLTPTEENLLLAADALRAGQLVGMPTETVYGLGANALDPDAVHAIFAAKGRPADNPLIVHVPTIEAAEPLCHIDERSRRVMEHFNSPYMRVILDMVNLMDV
jgi:L-threonylcarbamoyladenylate synthase